MLVARHIADVMLYCISKYKTMIISLKCELCGLLVSQDGGGKYKGRHQVLSSTATITINVIDAQDMPPSFIGTPYFGYIYEVSVPVSPLLIQY